MSLGLLKLIVLLCGLCLLPLSACGPRPALPMTGDRWQAQDLRILTLPDRDDPSADLFAAYSRVTQSDLELRFDIFDTPDPRDLDLTLYIDADAGGGGPLPAGWDLLVTAPALGQPAAVLADGSPAGIRPRLVRDGVQDSIAFRLSLADLKAIFSTPPEQYSVHLLVSRSGQAGPLDQLGPFTVGGPPSGREAGLVLVFWDTLPAASPVQALRRWDGAHTGPYGQRHGLSILLRESARSGIPLVLLDLNHPSRLAALEALGGLPLVRELSGEGHLLIPDLQPGPVTGAPAGQPASDFKLRRPEASRSFVYGPSGGDAPTGYQAAFARLEPADSMRIWQNMRLVPLPGPLEGGVEQVGEQGLSRAARAALLKVALSPQAGDLLVLGGSLPRSAWGDLLSARMAFEYIRAHPWIRVLDGPALLAYPAQNGLPDCADLLCLPDQPTSSETASDVPARVQAALEDAPDNLFRQLAWQAYLSLAEPAADSRLRGLRAAYLGQIGPLLAAAEWLQSPAAQAACSQDLDWDGLPECILSSSQSFLVIDPQGGRLVLAVVRTTNGPVQIIGQRSQLVVGLGDPSEWRLERGAAGDPQDIPGAFSDAGDAFQLYEWEILGDQIRFVHPQTAVRKTYRLIDRGLSVTIESASPISTQLPLLLMDRQAYRPGWYTNYQHNPLTQPGSWRWERAGGARVDVSVDGARLSVISFAEGLPVIAKSENPNMAYPEGAFLPFPLALLQLESPGTFTITLNWAR